MTETPARAATSASFTLRPFVTRNPPFPPQQPRWPLHAHMLPHRARLEGALPKRGLTALRWLAMILLIRFSSDTDHISTLEEPWAQAPLRRGTHASRTSWPDQGDGPVDRSALSAFSLTACGGDDGGGSESTEVTVWLSLDQSIVDGLQPAVDAKAAAQGITVKLEKVKRSTS